MNHLKNKNIKLFRDLEQMNIYDIQNYIPVYDSLYEINETSANTTSLNVEHRILSIEKQTAYNECEAFVTYPNQKKRKRTIFMKFAPIIDPIRYMAGKYKDCQLSLPKWNQPKESPIDIKINNPNNAAYIDGLFSYISSGLMSKGCIHSLHFYGMYLGIHRALKTNIIDDLEFLSGSSYFHDNLNSMFHIDNDDIFSVFSQQSGVKKNRKINILSSIKTQFDLEELENLHDNFTRECHKSFIQKDSHTIDDENEDCRLNELNELNELTVFNLSDECIQLVDQNNESCSSASSLTCDDSECNSVSDDDSILDEDVLEDTKVSLSESDYDTTTDDDEDDESSEMSYIEAITNNFPVAVICMEKCSNTLDHLIENCEMNTSEWVSCLFQVIMTLIIYQNAFKFTHNDLHTSNIMYVETKRKYIYYEYEKNRYKVPTFGRIYKIIDFGRSIFTYNDKLYYSDAFDKTEDAATQYNFGPIYTDTKKEVPPNMSFDLCRLGCSLYDYFKEYYTVKTLRDKELKEFIFSLCNDDNGKNILYKSTGEERYPDFKLYKMITRHVHHCVPSERIKHDIFQTFKTVKNANNDDIVHVSTICKF